MFVCGDFNYNFLNPNDKNVSDVTNLFSSYGFTQVVKNNFSRVQGNSKTLIDNIFTNINFDKLNIITIDPGLSDHCSQMVTFKADKVDINCKTIHTRMFTNGNINYFKTLLSNELWVDMYDSASVKTKFTKFFSKFSILYNLAFPIKVIEVKNDPKSNRWITPGLLEESRFLREIHLLDKIYKDPELHLRYNILKKETRKKYIS